uniref:NADH-ubiquinone oxidoreductase chain 6 n=1 Tax=Coleoptera sp. 1 AH-2016 TaxID=1903823 RepID=A0A343C2E9_9COLE|nr:NADH dehydrogenase subunit 6 [Coleoptera sp. 1 AH-2016]
MNIFFSMIFIILNHPLSMGSILLIQTITVALLSGYLFFNFWLSYILFLIMIGGLLVMFIYMTSIASNNKFQLPKFSLIFMSINFMIMMITINYFLDNFFSNMINLMIPKLSWIDGIENLSLSKYFNYPSMFILITLMIYLLITLIAIVKIIEKKNLSLRQK